MPAASALGPVKNQARVTFPVIEVFGPTIQGEGPDAGRPAYFVRFGGCDFRCSWCDSMYAVDPEQVRAEARHLEAHEIVAEVNALPPGPEIVVLSGGNPALLDLGPLVKSLHAVDLEVAVETQGSRWKPWLAEVDCLVVSPKGPSSGMDTPKHRQALEQFLAHAHVVGAAPRLKAVIFDDADLGHARWLARSYPGLPLHLSTGTDVGLPEAETIERLLVRFRWLSERVAVDVALCRARVSVQQHVLAWGTRRGV
jgi:7-carboxy-7-deazaguanine synthase